MFFTGEIIPISVLSPELCFPDLASDLVVLDNRRTIRGILVAGGVELS